MTLEVNPLQVQSALITVVMQMLDKMREAGLFESKEDIRALLQQAAGSNRAEYNPINQGAADFIEQVLLRNPLVSDDA